MKFNKDRIWKILTMNIFNAIVAYVRSKLNKKNQDGQSSQSHTTKEEKEKDKNINIVVQDAEKNHLKLKLETPTFPVEYIVIHHSWTLDTEKNETEAITRYHKETKKWTDNGYHFLLERIDDKYKILKGRPMDRIGAHARDGRMNNKSLGICLVGNFDKGNPPQEQLFLAYSLVRQFQRQFNVPAGKVVGHREVQEMARVAKRNRKTCPGEKFDMNEFRNNLIKEAV